MDANKPEMMDDASMDRRRFLAKMGMAGAGVALTAFGVSAHAGPVFAKNDKGPKEPKGPKASLSGVGSGQYNVRDYGAVGNGVTDDTVAVQKAVNAAAAAGGGEVLFPYSANGYLMGDIVLTKPVRITGVGREVIIKAKASTSRLFTIRSSQVEIRGFFIEMAAAGSSAVAFYLDTAATGLEHIYFRDLKVHNAYAVLRDADSTNIIVMLHLDNVVCRINRGVAIHLKDAFAYTFFNHVHVDNVPSMQLGINVNFSGIIVENAQGVQFAGCDVTGGNGLAGAHGFVIKNTEAVFFDKCMADTLGGTGFVFETVWYIYLVTAISSLCYRGGFSFTNCQFVNATNVVALGRNGLPDHVADMPGVIARNSAHIVFSTLSCRFNTGNGLTVDSCTFTNWNNNHLFANTGWGIVESNSVTGGMAMANIFTGCNLGYNTAGNCELTSPSAVISSAMLHSGAFEVSKSGPVII